MSNGFTLLELLLALAIFSLVSALTYSSIATGTNVALTSQKHGDKLRKIQLAWHIIDDDFRNMLSRPVRTGNSSIVPAYAENLDGFLVTFTRGAAPSLWQPGVSIARVGYRIEDNNLYRFYWSTIDNNNKTAPDKMLLVADIDSFIIDGYFATNERDKYLLPRSVIVTIISPDFGSIEKYYLGGDFSALDKSANIIAN